MVERRHDIYWACGSLHIRSLSCGVALPVCRTAIDCHTAPRAPLKPDGRVTTSTIINKNKRTSPPPPPPARARGGGGDDSSTAAYTYRLFGGPHFFPFLLANSPSLGQLRFGDEPGTHGRREYVDEQRQTIVRLSSIITIIAATDRRRPLPFRSIASSLQRLYECASLTL